MKCLESDDKQARPPRITRVILKLSSFWLSGLILKYVQDLLAPTARHSGVSSIVIPVSRASTGL